MPSSQKAQRNSLKTRGYESDIGSMEGACGPDEVRGKTASFSVKVATGSPYITAAAILTREKRAK
jgi:hypothetical protein